MAEVVHEDLVEQILIRSDVKDLIRYKSVCKSWRSLITSSRFFIRHKDRCNNEHGDRRIILHNCDIKAGYRLVGSSNGLVCVSSYSRYKVFVGNPITREVRYLEPPPNWTIYRCWGFGYDSSRDDYKVLLSTSKDHNQTHVQVLSLKSNTWRDIGKVKHKFNYWQAGMLCNGALHWIVRSDDKDYKIIVSYDLSNDEFKEILIPVDARFLLFWNTSYLGIHKGCLFICPDSDGSDIWVMNKYGVKESWEMLRKDIVMKYDTLSYLDTTLQEHAYGRSISQPDKSLFSGVSECISSHTHMYHFYAPIYGQSLVSPHLNEKIHILKEKACTKVNGVNYLRYSLAAAIAHVQKFPICRLIGFGYTRSDQFMDVEHQH